MMLNEEIDIIETIFVCGKSPVQYTIWNSRKKIIETIEIDDIQQSLEIGHYYKRQIPDEKNQISKLQILSDKYITNVITFGYSKNIIIVVEASVFIGTYFLGLKKCVGYNDFFGRVFFDTSYTAVKIEKFKTYVCLLCYDPHTEFECKWYVKQLICLSDEEIKYYLIDCKIPENIDDKIICTKNNIRVELEKSDFRETLNKEAMITSLPVYTIAFKTEPLHYICCYATLTNDFGDDLAKNAMIVNERTGCCDEFAEARINELNRLCHNSTFLTNLRLYPELEERIFSLMLDL